MKLDSEELPKELREITSDVTNIGTLYFTPAPRWEFIAEVMHPSKPSEPKIWPEDSLHILARVLMMHLIRVFHKRLEDPAGFEELRKNAPAKWCFGSIKTA